MRLSGRGSFLAPGLIRVGFAVVLVGSVVWAGRPDGRGGGEFSFEDARCTADGDTCQE